MKFKTIFTIVMVALVSAGLTYTLLGKSAPSPQPSPPGEGAEAAPDKIEGLEIALAVAGEGWDTIDATGKITVPPDRLVKITPRISGKVIAARGTIGDIVSQGQVMATISSVDLAEARALYRQSLAKLNAAKNNFAREQQIAKLGANSIRPVEEARAEALSEQGNLADAKSELAQAKSELVKEESDFAQCKAKLDRAKELYSDKIISKQDLESAEAQLKMDAASIDVAKSKVSQAEDRIEKTKSKVEIAQQYLSREEKVYSGKVYDMRAVQTAKSELESAEIEVNSAADRIRVLGANPAGSGDTLAIVSPISGRIVSRLTNVGEMASPENALFTVANMGRVWIEADIYEKDLAKVRKGLPVEIRVDAYPGKIFSGKVDSVSDMLSSESRTAKARCVVDNSQALLRGEMFAKITIISAKRGSTVLIPKEAVLDEAGKKIVFTVCRDCAEPDYEKAEVTTGPSRGDKIEVLSGLKAGTEVVTVGAYQLKTSLGSAKLKAGCADAACED